jgi:hypothetical protein
MGFDAQAFATAFLEGQAADIKERFKEAKTESDRRKELARTAGMTQYRKRKTLAAKYLQWANSLKSKGMDDDNLSYLASNPSALATVFDSVNKFEQEHGRSMKANRLNELITLTNDYASPVDDNGFALKLPQQIERAAGLYMQNYTPDPQQDEDNMLQSVFGFNAKDRIDAQLRERTEIDNLTTYDLYQMGTTGDYTPDEMANININYSELPSAPSATENVLQTETFNRLLKTAVVKDYNRVFKVVDNFDGTAEEALAAGVIDQQDFNLLDLGNRVVISEDTEDKILTGYTTGQLTDLYGTQAMMQIAELYPNWESNNELKALAPNQFESTVELIEQRKGLPVISGTSADDYNASIDVLIREDKLKAGSKVYLKDLYMTADVTEDDVDRAKGTKDVLPSTTAIMSEGKYKYAQKDPEELMADTDEEEVKILETPESNLTSIFNRAEPVSSAKSARIKMPDLSDAEKASISKHIETLKKEYEYYKENSPSSSGTRKGIKYKGTSYFGFDRYLRTKLIEEYPNIDVRILGQFAKDYGK